MTDRLWRAFYFAAYRTLRVWWFVRRPASYGAFVALWVGDEVLLVRNSYRRGETFPCGRIERGETPRAAAKRELAEEVGIHADEEALRFAGEFVVAHDSKQDHAFVFELVLREQPAVRVDRREVVWADFVPESDLGERPLSPHLRAYLARRAPPANQLR